ncbi:MAG: hypothetical protein GQ582_09015 [Methyloprofundus sp.]|nr:hypothetical protein [Methyloprofundus sp.]
MSGLLASVNSLEEALIVLDSDVDIIDLKQPALGALGALDTRLVSQIVSSIAAKKTLSATVGDLPMQADLLFKAVKAMADTGVDYIKIGFFPDGDWQAVIDKLSLLTAQGLKLIAVLFADQQPDFKIVARLAKAGFTGVMLDTMDKSKGSLIHVMSLSDLQQFVTLAKQYHLLCGLAGSLREPDINILRPLKADYLGFRGALCIRQQRVAAIDRGALQTIIDKVKAC